MSYVSAETRPWYRGLIGFCGFALLATGIAAVLFAGIVVVLETTVDGVSSYLLEGFTSALIIGLLFSVPAPVFAVLVGYPLWLRIVPRLEQRGWARGSVLVAGSTGVALCASLGLFWFFWGEVTLLPDLASHLLLITLPGIIGANIAARLIYLKAA